MKLEIPNELVSSLNKGKVVLFVGHDIDLSESGLPSIDNLTSELAQQTQAWVDCRFCKSADRCTHPNECILPLPQVATFAEQELGRDYLERFLVEKLTQNTQPTPTLQAIARLPAQIIITTAYDERLEAAYRAADKRYQTIATDSQIVTDESAQVQIIHWYGVLSQPKSLVLTGADHAALANNKPLTSLVLQSYLATRACLFMATDFNDPYLQTLYSKIVTELGRLRQRPYILGNQRKQNVVDVQHLQATPLEFLVTLRSKLDYRPITLPEPPKPEAPYKFLDFFEAKDRKIFIGRDAETRELTSRIMSHRITVLSALSGRGKTSLLHAGVIPHLEFEGFKVEVVRLGSDPLAAFQAVVQPITSFSDSQAHPIISAQLSSMGQVLIIDQAEELFTVIKSPEARSAFVNALLAWMGNTELNPHVLLSLRAEYQANLEDLFESQGRSDISSNRFRLGALGPEQTRQAILKPATLFGIEFEETLINILLADLETAGFEPPQLQIICHRLFQSLQESGKAATLKLTLTRYEKLGKAKGIIADFLDEALMRIGDEPVQDNVRAILKNMVTTEQTKVALKAKEIAKRVIYASLDETVVKQLLGSIQAQRIIRVLEDGSYELAHDVLAEKIWGWMNPMDIARLNAEQTLKKAMADYKKHKYLMTADKQRPISEAADALTFNADELAFLLMSAVAIDPHGADRRWAQAWIKRIKESSDIVDAVLDILQVAQKSQDREVQDSAYRAEVLIDPNMRIILLNILTQGYNLSEIKDICFRLDIDFDRLHEETKSGKSRDLISNMETNGHLDLLFAITSHQRPALTKFHLKPPPLK
jgi:hypothetical protein